MPKLISSLATSIALLTPASCASITISASSQVPTTAPVDHSFPGFGVDGIFLVDYAGNKSTPGVYSRNLIENVANRSGAPAFMRMGGTSYDHAGYDASLKQPIKEIPKNEQKQNTSISVGPSYFESFSTWPGVKWIYQVPLGSGSLENSLALAKEGVKAIGTNNLHALEIGNEPRSQSFGSPKDYVEQWLHYSKIISANVSGLPSGPIYQGLTLAASATPPFDVKTMFQEGIDRLNNLKTVSHHFYEVFLSNVDNTASYLQNTLLNHQHLVQTTAYLKNAVTFLKQNESSIPFVLGEIGSGLARGDKNETQIAEIESSLGTAIWTVDFHMYMMSIGVQSVSNQLGTPWAFSPWRANVTDDNGATYPPYYGILFAADALGADTSSPTRVSELTSPNGNITAYGVYQNSVLSKVAICNLELWSANANKGTRPKEQIVLNLPNNVKANNAKVEKLTGPDGFDRYNTTYGGYAYKYESKGQGVKVLNNTETLKVNGGQVTVEVLATEAVLVSFS